MKKEGALMVRTGRVVAQENGQIEVCFDRPEACAHCGGCGQKQRTLLRFPGEAAVGSRVDVEMPEGRLASAALLAYGLPLAGLLLGLWLGSLLFPGEALAALCALLLMGGGGLALKALDPHLRKKQAFQPRILAVYQEGERKNGTDADEG